LKEALKKRSDSSGAPYKTEPNSLISIIDQRSLSPEHKSSHPSTIFQGRPPTSRRFSRNPAQGPATFRRLQRLYIPGRIIAGCFHCFAVHGPSPLSPPVWERSAKLLVLLVLPAEAFLPTRLRPLHPRQANYHFARWWMYTAFAA